MGQEQSTSKIARLRPPAFLGGSTSASLSSPNTSSTSSSSTSVPASTGTGSTIYELRSTTKIQTTTGNATAAGDFNVYGNSDVSFYETEEEWSAVQDKDKLKVALESHSTTWAYNGATAGAAEGTAKADDGSHDEGTGELITMEGWLNKQSTSTMSLSRKKWQSRYFILKQGSLYYYLVVTEGTIKLDDVTVECTGKVPVQLEPNDPNKVGYKFTLIYSNPSASSNFGRQLSSTPPSTTLSSSSSNTTASVASLFLAAASERQLRDWLEVLEATQRVARTVQTNTISSSPTVGASKEPAVVWPQKKGWLWVSKKITGVYNLRYVTVKDGQFEFARRDQRGFIPLLNCRLEVTSEDGFSFSIVSPTRRLVLSADSKETRDPWVETLSREIVRVKNPQKPSDERITKLLEGNEHNAREYLEFFHTVRDILENERRDQKRRNVRPPIPSRPTRRPGPLRILAIDGGGLRGIMNCVLLERILEEFPDFLDHVDVFAGTSNGGMIAAGLAYGHTPGVQRSMLELCGRSIFSKKGAGLGVNSAKFGNKMLKILCDEMWSDRRLSECSKYLVLTAVLLDNHAADPKERNCEIKLFHNFDTDDSNSMNHEKASDCVMRTIAAPTYFPAYQTYVDGGMFAHDPADSALSLALNPARQQQLGINGASDIALLSFGTGHVNHYFDDPASSHARGPNAPGGSASRSAAGASHDWGYVQWLPRLVDLLWECMIQKSGTICRELLATRYHRIDPPLGDKNVPMDDPNKIPQLIEIAQSLDLTDTFRWIREHFYAPSEVSLQPTNSAAVPTSGPVPVPRGPISRSDPTPGATPSSTSVSPPITKLTSTTPPKPPQEESSDESPRSEADDAKPLRTVSSRSSIDSLEEPLAPMDSASSDLDNKSTAGNQSASAVSIIDAVEGEIQELDHPQSTSTHAVRIPTPAKPRKTVDSIFGEATGSIFDGDFAMSPPVVTTSRKMSTQHKDERREQREQFEVLFGGSEEVLTRPSVTAMTPAKQSHTDVAASSVKLEVEGESKPAVMEVSPLSTSGGTTHPQSALSLSTKSTLDIATPEPPLKAASCVAVSTQSRNTRPGTTAPSSVPLFSEAESHSMFSLFGEGPISTSAAPSVKPPATKRPSALELFEEFAEDSVGVTSQATPQQERGIARTPESATKTRQRMEIEELFGEITTPPASTKRAAGGNGDTSAATGKNQLNVFDDGLFSGTYKFGE